ncbi:adp-ribosylation factor family protein [Cystoisospora suis]|uniref:Adp-ribosylation factor family protein n=1 Tax=Cystoisospora suis TaxID=483139 RepID=A0A2C6L7W4_9APIC|nr:adp-ribosylation factor family protein [Cystoisospora suis]
MVCMLPGMELFGRQSQEPRSQTRFFNQVSGLPSRSSSSPWATSSSAAHRSGSFKQRLFQVFRILLLLCSLLAECFTAVAEVFVKSARRLGAVCGSFWNGGDVDWSSFWRTSGEDDLEGNAETSFGLEGGGRGGGKRIRKGGERKKLDSRAAPLPRRLRILLCGPVHSGKTALLYRLKIGSFIPTVPSMGAYKEEFSVELEVHHRPTATTRQQSFTSCPGSSSSPANIVSRESFPQSSWNAEINGTRAYSGDSFCEDALLEEGYMSSGAGGAGWKEVSHCQEVEKKNSLKSRKEEKTSFSFASGEKVSCEISQQKVHLTIWDLAGGEGLETRWRAMQEECDAVIYVLDSTLFTSPEKSLAKQRAVEDARREILGLFYEEYFVLHKEIRFLIFITKQDLRTAASASQVLELLELPDDFQARLLVMPCSSVSGAGLVEGLQWLVSDGKCTCFEEIAERGQLHEERGQLPQEPVGFLPSTGPSSVKLSSSTTKVETERAPISLTTEVGGKPKPSAVDSNVVSKVDGCEKRCALSNGVGDSVHSEPQRRGSVDSASPGKLREKAAEMVEEHLNKNTVNALVDLLNDRGATEERNFKTDISVDHA